MPSVRAAAPADRDVIVEYNIRLAAESEDMHLDPDLVTRGVALVLEDPGRGRYFLAEQDGRVIGQTMITLEWSDWRCGWFWWIQSVYVHPDWRGQGVFRQLQNHVMSRARERDDVCGVRLYVDRDNRIAQQVYDRTGLPRAHYEMREVDFHRMPEE